MSHYTTTVHIIYHNLCNATTSVHLNNVIGEYFIFVLTRTSLVHIPFLKLFGMREHYY
jgi:hypothetical protein